ncbi:hypothetical protein [Nitrosococcus halophilus]|uniref:hypothetical protein n=1 Tax=Nitrosococcus halophilus TaxID=133539 RepID=UPI0012FEF62F|nr:hypothetical protein [Nitrosococcus halophilus]
MTVVQVETITTAIAFSLRGYDDLGIFEMARNFQLWVAPAKRRALHSTIEVSP